MDINLMEFVFVRMLTVNSQMVMLEWVSVQIWVHASCLKESWNCTTDSRGGPMPDRVKRS